MLGGGHIVTQEQKGDIICLEQKQIFFLFNKIINGVLIKELILKNS